MEGDPLCQFSAAVKAVAVCGEGRICFRSFSSSHQAGLSLQQMLHHQSVAGEEDVRDLLRSGLEQKHTNEMSGFKMSTRSLGIIESIQ